MPGTRQQQITSRDQVDLVGLDAPLPVGLALHRHMARVQDPQLPTIRQHTRTRHRQVVVARRFPPHPYKLCRHWDRGPDPRHELGDTPTIKTKLERLDQLTAREVRHRCHRRVLTHIDRDRDQTLEHTPDERDVNLGEQADMRHLQGAGRTGVAAPGPSWIGTGPLLAPLEPEGKPFQELISGQEPIGPEKSSAVNGRSTSSPSPTGAATGLPSMKSLTPVMPSSAVSVKTT